MKEKQFNLIPVAGTSNKVFVTLPPKREKTIGNEDFKLILVADLKEENIKRENEGTVIAISEADANGIKPTIKVGDYVFFSEYAGLNADFEGTEYLVMKEADIYAKLKK